jgi:hypothetical protein
MAKTIRQGNPTLFMPELLEPEPGPWEVNEVDIQDSAVDTKNRRAWVPKAHTPSQRLARLHEGGHVKYSPRDWEKRILRAMAQAKAMLGKNVDPNAVEKIQKMLEENRIDWILWDRHSIDLRPARETLDWGKMPDPPHVLYALGMCLQLAWTVWASRGLGSKAGLSNPPPARATDPDTGEYFDKCWGLIAEENEPLCRAMIRGCMRMYTNPTHDMRDQVAAELATFFPLEEEEKEKQPAPKKEEQEAQDKAERREQEHAEYLDDLETGVGSEIHTEGRIQYHDHTATVRRPSMRIARRAIPVSQGIGLRFPHRYFTDKGIFAQRLLTEAGIMIDGSSSMSWTDEDMKLLMEKLPAVKIGLYSGVHSVRNAAGQPIVGRICILAKDGRFARFDGKDKEMDGSNEVDYEALQLLAKWPKPRLWLSDGFVCGGLHSGPPKYHPEMGYYNHRDGRIHELCNAWMKAHEIYRVPNQATMHKLLKREKVRLYRTTTPHPEDTQIYGDVSDQFPVKCEPVVFQL